MNSEQFETYLQSCVERRRKPDRVLVRETIEACDRCRALWKEFQLVERALVDWRPLDETPDLTDRVLAELAGDSARVLPQPASKTSSLPRSARIALALTACVLLALLIPLIGSFQSASAPRDLAGSPPRDETTPVVVDRSRTIRFEHLLGQTRGAAGLLFAEARTSLDSLEKIIEPTTVSDNMSGQGNLPTPEDDSSPMTLLQEELRQSIGFLSAFYPDSDPGT